MIIDLEQHDLSESIETDVCIIGAGPAGISLALTLVKKNPKLTVSIVESGGEKLEAASLQLADGDVVGRGYFPLMATRRRELGGTTGHWAGWCAPFNELDFAAREWIDKSGWPITYSEISKYYPKAYEFFDLSGDMHEKMSLAEQLEPYTGLNASDLVTRYWQFSNPPMRVGQHYRDELAGSKSISVYLHANVTSILLTENLDSISELQLSLLSSDKKYVAKAKQYVLAAGGIENARILLNSNDQIPDGIGNEKELVGRYFHEHVEADLGTLHVENMRAFTKFKRHRFGDDPQVGGAFCPSDELQREKRIGNCAIWFRALDRVKTPQDGWGALLSAKQYLRRLQIPPQGIDKLKKTIADLDYMLGVGWLNSQGRSISPVIDSEGAINLISLGEQTPNRNSRVRLTEKKDVFGKRMVAVDWQLVRQDYDTIRETTLALATDVAKSGAGRLQLKNWLADNAGELPEDTRGGHHHMGATRMADTAADGVVDANSKVYGMQNMYVAGSSVFPTGGYANPTLTIVAMAIRLGDYLAENTNLN